jgi:hypothetical protein
MKKTTVYLSEEEAAALRVAARTTGKSQAELIREGIRRVVNRQPKKRVFHSMGIAASTTPPVSREEMRADWLQHLLEHKLGKE